SLGSDLIKILFSENPGVVIQVKDEQAVLDVLKRSGVNATALGTVTNERTIKLEANNLKLEALPIDSLRDTWFHTSYLLDKIQRPKGHAEKRKENYSKQVLEYKYQS